MAKNKKSAPNNDTFRLKESVSDPLSELREQKKADQGKVYKGGPLSNADKKLISKYCDAGMNDVEIGELLNRPETTIFKYRHNELFVGEDIELDDKDFKERVKALTKRVEWKNIKEELLESEFYFFQHTFVKVTKSLEDDINDMDELLIIELCRFMTLAHRNLVSRKETIEHIANLKDVIREYMKELNEAIESDDKVAMKEAKDNINQYNQQVAFLDQANAAKTGEYKAFSEKSNDILHHLKATRSQRIQKLESKKRTSYLSLIQELDDEKVQKRESDSMKLMKASITAQTKKLGKLYKFADGTFDRPLHTAETNKFED